MLLLDYNLETGDFVWIKQNSPVAQVGALAGSVNKLKGYRFIGVNKKKYLAHRLAWLYVYGEWPENQIDHINHIKTDNRISNLRDVTNEINQKNSYLNENSSSGINGVCWNKRKGRWSVRVSIEKKRKFVGYYETIFDAAAAYIKASRLCGYHENHGSSRPSPQKVAIPVK